MHLVKEPSSCSASSPCGICNMQLELVPETCCLVFVLTRGYPDADKEADTLKHMTTGMHAAIVVRH